MRCVDHYGLLRASQKGVIQNPNARISVLDSWKRFIFIDIRHEDIKFYRFRIVYFWHFMGNTVDLCA